ncbi:MAG: sulfite exporter TauE/SafE family protein [Nitrospirae bacterium]|nr:sulfite exporter TauE/SafE family protein [Nitrospirota bacterium]
MLSTESIYIAYFLTGLLGGFGHCAGMCGPVVFGYTGVFGGQRQTVHSGIKSFLKPLMIHIYYNIGRTTTYMFLGGLVSAGVSVLGILRIQGLQQMLMVITGSLMVLAGLLTGGFIKTGSSLLRPVTDRLIRFLARLRMEGRDSMLLPFGIIMGFLPCGLLYTALIGVSGIAVEEKDSAMAILRGISLMGIFGLATSVSLILTGLVSRTLFMESRRWLYRAAAIIMIVLGIILIWRAT